MKIAKTFRDVDSELIKEFKHLAIDEERNEGELLNEAIMLLLRTYENKNRKLKKLNQR